MAQEQSGGGSSSRKVALVAGIGLIAVGAYQLTKKPPTPPPAPTPAPGPTPTPTRSGYVVTAQPSLIVRSGPGTGYVALGALTYGTQLNIVCQGYGSVVQRSSIWDQITSPWGAGWVSDWYVSTPGVGVFTAGLARCGGTAPGGGGPPPVVLPPTGLTPIANTLQLQPGMIIATTCALGNANWVVDRGGAGLLGLQLRLVKRWIADQASWNALNAPRSAIRLVTLAAVRSIPDGSQLQIATDITRGLPGVRVWSFGGPPSLVTSNAGYCT